jgi:hypothetical protein
MKRLVKDSFYRDQNCGMYEIGKKNGKSEYEGSKYKKHLLDG